MTGRKGYVLGVSVFVLGLAVGAVAMGITLSRLHDFPRIAMPGTGTVALPAGDLIGYGEPANDSFGADAISARCAARDAQGAVIKLSRPSANVSYGFGGFQGASLLELDVPVAGDVTIQCEAETPFQLAIGPGIGAGIGATVASVFGGSIAGLMIMIRTWRRRRDQAREARLVTTV